MHEDISVSVLDSRKGFISESFARGLTIKVFDTDVFWRCYLLQEEPVPLAFFVRGEAEVVSSLGSCVKTLGVETEQVLPVVYQPQAVFRVRAVARCTSTLQGHTEAVISTAFSPTGK